ncbi:hypothetical protein RBC57_004597 [Salmonella enterica]|uniref:Fimbrial protein n=1 Tax=Salmonella enterica TaxID=28901 RepID=A0A628V9I0_SALER|nr:hypothetical protein [Salmonella enterica]EEC6702092.1 hypothetical protein [Salmonella enterica]ELF5202350.1 hypothetical protein [Salmonella enterica]
MNKKMVRYIQTFAVMVGMTGLPVCASPVTAQTEMTVRPAVQVSHEIQVSEITSGNGFDTGTTLAIGMVSSSVPFSSLNLKWDRSINPKNSGSPREAYAVNPVSGRKIPVGFAMSDRMDEDTGNDSVTLIFDGAKSLSDYTYAVILTHAETLYAGSYPIGVMADVVIA